MGGKDMDRWLGDGGMPIIALVGGAFTAYGVDGEDLGWVAGTFTPEELACNPHGVTQAGIHSLLLDAGMNFAINAALPGRDRTRGTLEMKTETMRPALRGTPYVPAGRGGAHGQAGGLRRGVVARRRWRTREPRHRDLSFASRRGDPPHLSHLSPGHPARRATWGHRLPDLLRPDQPAASPTASPAGPWPAGSACRLAPVLPAHLCPVPGSALHRADGVQGVAGRRGAPALRPAGLPSLRRLLRDAPDRAWPRRSGPASTSCCRFPRPPGPARHSLEAVDGLGALSVSSVCGPARPGLPGCCSAPKGTGSATCGPTRGRSPSPTPGAPRCRGRGCSCSTTPT